MADAVQGLIRDRGVRVKFELAEIAEDDYAVSSGTHAARSM